MGGRLELNGLFYDKSSNYSFKAGVIGNIFQGIDDGSRYVIL